MPPPRKRVLERDGAPEMRSRSMRDMRCSRSNRFTASTRPMTLLPRGSTALYVKSGTNALRSGHAVGQIDHPHYFVEACGTGTHQPNTVVGQGTEAASACGGEDVPRCRAPRDELIDST